MKEEIYYNTCEDDWTHADESIEVVAENFLEELTLEELKTVKSITLYKGVKKAQTFEDFMCVDNFIETMHERAQDEKEFAEDYLYDVTQEQKDELGELISGWAKKHNIGPRFFLIENVTEIVHEVDQEAVQAMINNIENPPWINDEQLTQSNKLEIINYNVEKEESSMTKFNEEDWPLIEGG